MQEGEYEAASVAVLPAQSPAGPTSAQAAAGKAAVAARTPIQEDKSDGEAHHRWPNGTEYFGEWHGGQPNGRGIFVWPSGEYDRLPLSLTWRRAGLQVTVMGHEACPLWRILKR